MTIQTPYRWAKKHGLTNERAYQVARRMSAIGGTFMDALKSTDSGAINHAKAPLTIWDRQRIAQRRTR